MVNIHKKPFKTKSATNEKESAANEKEEGLQTWWIWSAQTDYGDYEVFVVKARTEQQALTKVWKQSRLFPGEVGELINVEQIEDFEIILPG